MSRTPRFSSILAFALFLAPCAAWIGPEPEAIPYVNVQDTTTQQAQIHADVLAKRGTYAGLTDRGRQDQHL